MTGRLHMIPVPLGAESPLEVLAPRTLAAVRALDLFFVESAKSARAFLKAADHPRAIQTIEIREFSRDTSPADLDALLEPLRAGRDAGVLSEAGAPGVADPGARLARRAHRAGISVVPHVGPSSILLALMASGLDGQQFAFHGYLPIESNARIAALKRLEAQSTRDHATEIFIETPYRNDRMVAAMLEALAPETLVSIACDLGTADESVVTRTVHEWRAARPDLGKQPAVFALLAMRRRRK